MCNVYNVFKKIFATNWLIYTKYIFLVFVTGLYSCSYDMPLETEETKKVKEFITNLCPLSNELDTSKDIILATLYYNFNESNFYKEDESILNKVVTVFQACNNKVLILAHNSNKEVNTDPVLASKTSYLRSYNIYNYLKDNIPSNYLYFSFCSNLRNKFIEDNENAVLGNQRVEIIMLGNNVSSTIFKLFTKDKNGFFN